MKKEGLFFTFLCIAIACTNAFGQAMEEFNGPFPSWANVKIRFKAKGDGFSDDTRAIQQAIDELGSNSGNGKPFTVLYFPAGTYNISATLSLRGKIGVMIVGENPATTIIRWKGADGGTMFWANGSAYYKLSRFTWNANNRKEIEAIGIHWRNRWNDGKSQSYASLNIEISDNVFIGNCKFGISGGTGPEDGTNNNDSEIAIRRCVFNQCYGAGIITSGYNALDYWIWDCQFVRCNIGINSKYGNFHAYRSYFKNSVQADVTNTNGYYKSLRGCFSEGSRGLTVDSGASTNPFKRIYQGNIVLKPTWRPIQFYHQGRLFFLDNFFDKSDDVSIDAFVKTGSAVISLNNKYADKQFITFTNPAATQSFNDASKQSLKIPSAQFLTTLEKLPASRQRPVFEVPPGSNESIIQQIIDQASKQTGKRPIVHFPLGTYSINKTLLIPAGADIQLLGDGYLYASIIKAGPAFATGKPLLKIVGPTSISIRELQFGSFTNSNSGNDAIQFVNVDQQLSRAFVDQLYAVGNHSLRGDGLDYLYIQKDNSFFADNDIISGGPMMQANKGTAGLFGFGGQFAGLSLQKNARVVLKDCWWEGDKRLPVNLSGEGNLTIDGAMIAPNHADSNTSVSVQHFKGNLSLLNMYIQGGVQVEPENANLKIMIMNVHFYHTMNPLKFLTTRATFQGLFTGLSTQCFVSGDKKCDQIIVLPDQNNLRTPSETFIPELLKDDRNAMPKRYQVVNPAASNILISRVSIGDMNNAIRFSK